MNRFCLCTLLAAGWACASRFATPPPGSDAGFSGQWVNATSNLASMTSECGNMSFLSARPDSDMLIAGIAQKGLWASANGATTWTALGQGSGSAPITNRTSSVVYDPAHPGTFWESGLYNAGGAYRTTDNGTTFVQLGTTLTMSHSDLISVDFTDPARGTLLAGGHEQSATLHLSTNGGVSWSNIGANLPATAGNSSFPLVINAQAFLLGTWGSSGAGIFRSTDGGANWSPVHAGGVAARAFVASDETIYWVLETGGVVRSSDRGATWTQTAAAGTLSVFNGGTAMIELPGSRLISVGGNRLLLSTDRGVTWQFAGPAMPFAPSGIAWSAARKAIYAWHLDCGTIVQADAVQRLDVADPATLAFTGESDPASDPEP